ncbi:hypothetical protein GF336_07580 [Candidatus Woesearchaeota archaeon]|nr:hypothetical protein [Candidatus Woesearchaeota archaeon]
MIASVLIFAVGLFLQLNLLVIARWIFVGGMVSVLIDIDMAIFTNITKNKKIKNSQILNCFLTDMMILCTY